MLKNAQPIAYACSLAGQPVPAQTIWDFSFEAQTTSGSLTSSGSGTGSFVTSPGLSGDVGIIGGLHASDIVLRVRRTGSPQRSLTIRVGKPIDFHACYGATLRASIAVVSSTDPACARGATGTLTVSSAQQVAVQLCGRTFLKGADRVVAQIHGA